MAVALVFCVIGMCLFGYTMSVGSPSALCAFFQGVMYVSSWMRSISNGTDVKCRMVGVLIGIFATLSYALDAFRSQSNEIFIMNMLFKVKLDDAEPSTHQADTPSRRTSCSTVFQTLPTRGLPPMALDRSCTSLLGHQHFCAFSQSRHTCLGNE